mmetsp:Transcript_17708/g.29859  ORF Transcript_17708/g.29859 Transcript_17708/m.29859 type:complete len:426 (+) Transcript_17708:401-1678(+)
MSFLVVLECICFLLLTCSRGGAVDEKERTKRHWLLIHYHKTGHDLARHLATTFNAPPCHVSAETRFFHRRDLHANEARIRASDISVLGAPDMLGPWNGEALNLEADQMKMIHFVRNPFDMVVSAYLYHIQYPIPSGELWLVQRKFNPCEIDYGILVRRFGKKIAQYQGDRHVVPKMIDDVVHTCYEILNSTVLANVSKSCYHCMLTALPPADGLILEAARSILSKSGGDILRMAANTLAESETVPRMSRRFFLSDFPLRDKEKFTTSVQNMFTFLMAPSATTTTTVAPLSSQPSSSQTEEEHWRELDNVVFNTTSHPNTTLPVQQRSEFWHCMNVSEATSAAVERAFLDMNEMNQSRASAVIQQTLSPAAQQYVQQRGIKLATDVQAHITSDKVSSAKHSQLITSLQKHSTIGPMLGLVEEILMQ